jgi:hypothetical protein
MRRPLFALAIIAFVLSWTLAAHALTVSGRVLDQNGQAVAGAIISDEINGVASGANGGFKLETEPGRVLSITAPAGFAAPDKWWWLAGQAAGEELSLRLRAKPKTDAPLIAFISDPHLFDQNTGLAKYPVTAHMASKPMRAWGSVAGELKKLSPALIIVAGDLCADLDKGDGDHAKAQMALGAMAMAQLPGLARAIPGNHDVRYADGKAQRRLWRQYMGPARQVFLLKGAAFILLDNLGRGESSKGKPRSCGNLPDEALAWLEQVLPLIPSKDQLYVVSHYPPLTPIAGSNPLHKRSLVRSQRDKGLALRDTDQNFRAMAALLKDRNLAAFIHGHEHAAHQSVIFARKRFHVIGLPALCGGWWQGDRKWGPFGFPSAYGLLRLKSDPQESMPVLELIEVKY